MRHLVTLTLAGLAGCGWFGKTTLDEVGHLPGCCSNNYGGYDPAYGFFDSTYSCQSAPVEWDFNIVHEVVDSSLWSEDQGLSIADVHNVLSTIGESVVDSKANLSLSIDSAAIEAAGGTSDDYLVEDEVQRITFSDHIIEEGKTTIARTRCFPSSSRACAHMECGIIVSASTEIMVDGSLELWTIRYTTTAAAPEGDKASRRLSVSLQWLLAHEIGHTLGLDHPAGTLLASDTIMVDSLEAYAAADGSISYTGLGSTDKEALRFLYGKR